MPYVEEREFVLRFELRCEFPEDYDGEADGYVWAEEIQPLAAAVVKAAAEIFARQPGWSVRFANRGRPSDEEITIVAERRP